MSNVQLLEQHHRPGQFLGRHVEHDPRSLAYAHGVLPKSAITTVSWTRRAAILDQGNLGSCTGNALTGVFGTDASGYTGATSVTVQADAKGIFTAGAVALDEAFAVKVYELNTRLDGVSGQYPPDDTGSSGLACGKTAKQLGLASGYTHAFSIDAVKSGLQSGPGLLGTPWLNSMFDPQADGTLTVDKASGLAGGHEIVLAGYDTAKRRFRIDNSWGAAWGDKGRGYIAETDLIWLLGQGGDVVFLALNAPAPSPTPTPSPAPGMTAQQLADGMRGYLTSQGV